eukprot:CFRG3072T1
MGVVNSELVDVSLSDAIAALKCEVESLNYNASHNHQNMIYDGHIEFDCDKFERFPESYVQDHEKNSQKHNNSIFQTANAELEDRPYCTYGKHGEGELQKKGNAIRWGLQDTTPIAARARDEYKHHDSVFVQPYLQSARRLSQPNGATKESQVLIPAAYSYAPNGSIAKLRDEITSLRSDAVTTHMARLERRNSIKCIGGKELLDSQGLGRHYISRSNSRTGERALNSDEMASSFELFCDRHGIQPKNMKQLKSQHIDLTQKRQQDTSFKNGLLTKLRAEIQPSVQTVIAQLPRQDRQIKDNYHNQYSHQDLPPVLNRPKEIALPTFDASKYATNDNTGQVRFNNNSSSHPQNSGVCYEDVSLPQTNDSDVRTIVRRSQPIRKGSKLKNDSKEDPLDLLDAECVASGVVGRIDVNQRVSIPSKDGGRGVVRFVGLTKFAKGIWYGVELDTQTGMNDGTVDGVRYFRCAPFYGCFVPRNRLLAVEHRP